MMKIPILFFFLFLFFLTPVFAGGLYYPETELEEKVEESQLSPQVTIVNNYYNNTCREQVVYYHTPGTTIGGGVINAISALSYAGVGFNQALAFVGNSQGTFGMVGTSGLSQPVIKTCWVYQNQEKGEYK